METAPYSVPLSISTANGAVRAHRIPTESTVFATMSTTTNSDHTDEPADESSTTDKYTYGCPYCGETYSNELHTRVHVTRSTDSSHLNHNGMMPETEIKQLDDGDVVDTISRRPRDIDPSELTIDDYPDSLPGHHKHTLLIAARNPHENTYTKLAETANQRLTQHDIEAVSYSTIRRVIRSFYGPQVDSSEHSESAEQEQLTDLTAKQQALVIARLMHSEASLVSLASKVDCAESYPPQVMSRAAPIISRLNSKIEEGNAPQDVIVEALDCDAITDLRKRDLLTDVDIDLPEAVPDEESQQDEWGSPVSNAEGLTASPSYSDNRSNGQSPLSNTPSTDEIEPSSSSEDTDDEGTKSSDISHSEINQLRNHMAFVRAVLDRLDANNREFELIAGFATEIEQICEDILEH